MTTLLDMRPSVEDAPPPKPPSRLSMGLGKGVTGLLVIGPVVALAVAIPFLWGHAISWTDLFLAIPFYVVSGFGVTVGYHRLFAHRSFRPARWLKITLAAAGSLAVEGSVVGWVANHRRHHVFSDRPGDPHSPHLHGTGLAASLRGFAHAHVGWLFGTDTTSAERYAPELLNDSDTKMVSRLFPVIAIMSLAGPFFLGWTISGALSGAFTALLWAGLARMMLLHHVTWSVNSVCHMFGKQPATPEGPQHELRAARVDLVRRVVAQLPPCAPVIGSARCAAPSARPVRRAHPRVRTHGLRHERALADRVAARALSRRLTRYALFRCRRLRPRLDRPAEVGLFAIEATGVAFGALHAQRVERLVELTFDRGQLRLIDGREPVGCAGLGEQRRPIIRQASEPAFEGRFVVEGLGGHRSAFVGRVQAVPHHGCGATVRTFP